MKLPRRGADTSHGRLVFATLLTIVGGNICDSRNFKRVKGFAFQADILRYFGWERALWWMKSIRSIWLLGQRFPPREKGRGGNGNMLFVDNKLCCYINRTIWERKCHWVGAGTGCGWAVICINTGGGGQRGRSCSWRGKVCWSEGGRAVTALNRRLRWQQRLRQLGRPRRGSGQQPLGYSRADVAVAENLLKGVEFLPYYASDLITHFIIDEWHDSALSPFLEEEIAARQLIGLASSLRTPLLSHGICAWSAEQFHSLGNTTITMLQPEISWDSPNGRSNLLTTPCISDPIGLDLYELP